MLSLSVEEEVIMSPMIVILSNPILFVWTRDGRDGRNQMMVNTNCVHNITVSGCRVLTTDEVIECNFLLDGLMLILTNIIFY